MSYVYKFIEPILFESHSKKNLFLSKKFLL